MFVRIVWTDRPGRPRPPRGWRVTRRLPKGASDDLGIAAPDFSRMTKSLFDRPE